MHAMDRNSRLAVSLKVQNPLRGVRGVTPSARPFDPFYLIYELNRAWTRPPPSRTYLIPELIDDLSMSTPEHLSETC